MRRVRAHVFRHNLIEVKTERFIDNLTSITPGALKGGLIAVDRHPTKDELLCGGADGAPKIFKMVRTEARKIGDNDEAVRLAEAQLGEAGCDARDLVVLRVEVVEQRVFLDDRVGQPDLRLPVRPVEQRRELRDVREQAHVEHRDHDLDGDRVVRPGVGRHRQAAGLERVEERLVVDAEDLLEGIAPGVPVEEDEVDVGVGRPAGRREGADRSERPFRRDGPGEDGERSELSSLDQDRDRHDHRHRPPDPVDGRPGEMQPAGNHPSLDGEDREDDQGEHDDPVVAVEHREDPEGRGRAGAIRVAEEQSDGQRHDEPQGDRHDEWPKRHPDTDAARRDELEDEGDADDRRIDGDPSVG